MIIGWVCGLGLLIGRGCVWEWVFMYVFGVCFGHCAIDGVGEWLLFLIVVC